MSINIQKFTILIIVFKLYPNYNKRMYISKQLFIKNHLCIRGNYNLNLLSKFVVRSKKQIIIFFMLAMFICAGLFFIVPVNYNMTDYLPDEANSTVALDIMESEFEQAIPNLNVMVEDLTIAEALNLKEKIQNAEYVNEVIWLDNTLDLKIPLEMQNLSEVEVYYKDSTALFMVTVEAGKEQAAIASIKDVIEADCFISGPAAEQADAQEMSSQEAINSIMVLGPLIVLILILATTSWVEPICFLFTMGAAVLINLGTGYFLGGISFVTLAAAPVLQLAVSLDYVVFLSHSFNGFKEAGLEPVEAIKLAISKSGKAISSSMLTTLFGFLALMFMKFKIGSDMGLSLVKGVTISFICVMTFLPALLLVCSKWIDKTKHRPFIPNFKGIGNKLVKLSIPFMVVIIMISIPSSLAQKENNFFYGATEEVVEGSDAFEIEQVFGKTNSMVLLVPRGDSYKEALLSEELKEIENVTGVISYASMVSNRIPTAFLDEAIVNQFYSENYTRIILSLNCDYEGTASFNTVEAIRNTAEKYYPGKHLTCGQSANMYDMKVYVEKDNVVVNTITLISIYLVLALMTRSWLLPIPLILTIKCSIWLNMALPYFLGQSLSYIGYLIVSTVQMGATVDYAIILTDHYMENRKNMPKIPAMKTTLGEVFGTILISSVTLALSGVCMSGLSTNPIVKALGVLMGRGAVLALVLVVLLLPALILVIDKFIPYTTLKADFYNEKKHKENLDKDFNLEEAI